MHHRRIFRAIAVCVCALLTACARPVTTSSWPMLPGTASSAAVRPHWTRTSLGTFSDPYGVAVNPFCSASCDVIVADPGAKRVWKIAPDGTRSAIGDWLESPHFDPQGVAVDRGNNVYVADKAPTGTSLIWKVAPNGNTSPVNVEAARSRNYYRGVALTYGTHYGVPFGSTIVAAVEAKYASGNFGYLVVQTRASLEVFSDPFGVAASEHHLFVADAGAKTVYAGDETGGHPQALRTFVDPYGVAASWDGQNVYVADAGAKRVWERANDGTWSVVGDFADPYGVAVDGAGTVYVADPGSKNVWKLTR